MTHDYKRNGTTNLYAALNTATGKVLTLCQRRHRHNRGSSRLSGENRQARGEAGRRPGASPLTCEPSVLVRGCFRPLSKCDDEGGGSMGRELSPLGRVGPVM